MAESVSAAQVCPIRHCHGALEGPMIMCDRHMATLPARSLCALRRAARTHDPDTMAAAALAAINEAQRGVRYAAARLPFWQGPR